MTVFRLWINEVEHCLETIEPDMTLLHFIRTSGLTGSKLGCGEGGCGACTVAVGSLDTTTGNASYMAVNACLMPLAATHNRHVVTVEGIGSVNRPHLVQQAMAQDGSQCGFCTPGFIMSLWVAWRNGTLRDDRVAQALDGNLCRCTGYRPIIDAARQICALGERCCRVTGEIDKTCVSAEQPPPAASSPGRHPTQELIFPPKLRLHLQQCGQQPPSAATFNGSRVTWHAPVSLKQLLQLKHDHPEARIIFGNTEVGIETKFKQQHYPVMIYGGEVQELHYIREGRDGVEVGAGVRLAELDEYCQDKVRQGEHRYGVLAAVAEMLRWFAGNQIRNVSSWAGNVATASPISDLNPIWAASGARLTLHSQRDGLQMISVADFFLGYRKTALRPGHIIQSIHVPFLAPREYFWAQKQSKRRDDDIAIVNAAFRVKLDEHHCITDASLAYGGMGATTLTSKTTARLLIGQRVTADDFLEGIMPQLQAEFALAPDAVGGMVEYRQALVTSLFFKFYLFLCNQLAIPLCETLHSAYGSRSHAIPYQSSQYFPVAGEGGRLTGQAIPHLSALKHATGNAQYLDDIPPQTGELYAGLVLSVRAHARVLGIETGEAEALAGVSQIITFKDIPQGGCNKIGALFNDEHVFVEDKVTSIGQIIAIVLATDRIVAQRAAKLCTVQYQDLPAILTINVLSTRSVSISRSLIRPCNRAGRRRPSRGNLFIRPCENYSGEAMSTRSCKSQRSSWRAPPTLAARSIFIWKRKPLW